MVPHRKVLRALSLVALGRSPGLEYVAEEARRLKCPFPTTVTDFLQTEVFPFLPGALEAYLLTHDPAINQDLRPLMEAAAVLELSRYIAFTSEGASLNLPGRVEKWRLDDTVRIFIETCLLCEVKVLQISNDARSVWGVDVDEGDVHAFSELFVDPEYIRGDYWLSYAKCIGADEAAFKQQLMGRPTEYVRWKLGIPVALDSDKVLNRMISDAYFTERLIKSQAGGDALMLGKEHLGRVKVERDTIFKSMDRLLKLRELNGASGQNQYSEMKKALDALIITTVEEDMPTMEELNDEVQLMEELQDG